MKMTQQIDQHLTFLMTGPPFAGKTVLSSQFPQPYFVTLDPHCLMSVRALRKEYNAAFDCDFLQITADRTEDEDFIALAGKAFAGLTAWEKTKKVTSALLKNLSQDQTLIIDNLSRVGEDCLVYTKKTANRSRMQIQDWNIFIDEIVEFFGYFSLASRKCNTIIIAHDDVRKEELTGDIERVLNIPTRLRGRIPSLATDFLLLTADTAGAGSNKRVRRQLHSMPAKQANLGSRCLIPNMENPSYLKLKPYMEAALGRVLPQPNWTPPEDKK